MWAFDTITHHAGNGREPETLGSIDIMHLQRQIDTFTLHAVNADEFMIPGGIDTSLILWQIDIHGIPP